MIRAAKLGHGSVLTKLIDKGANPLLRDSVSIIID